MERADTVWETLSASWWISLISLSTPAICCLPSSALPATPAMSSVTLAVSSRFFCTTLAISSVESDVRAASWRTSSATTANPRPAPRPRRLDGGVQGQQIGLIGDGADGRDDGLDASRLLVELADEGDGLIHLGGDEGRGLHHGAQQARPSSALCRVSWAVLWAGRAASRVAWFCSMRAVMSLANFTTRTTLPLPSRMGL